MLTDTIKFAAESETASGVGALGLNLKSFLFQLVTFLIVLLLLRKFVFPRLVAVLEQRRQVLEQSLIQAKKTEEALAAAEEKASQLLNEARAQADTTLREAQKRAEAIVAKAEIDGVERAQRIIKDAEEHLDQERQRLRTELRLELAELVSLATEKVLRQKLDAATDKALVERSLKEVS